MLYADEIQLNGCVQNTPSIMADVSPCYVGYDQNMSSGPTHTLSFITDDWLQSVQWIERMYELLLITWSRSHGKKSYLGDRNKIPFRGFCLWRCFIFSHLSSRGRSDHGNWKSRNWRSSKYLKKVPSIKDCDDIYFNLIQWNHVIMPRVKW